MKMTRTFLPTSRTLPGRIATTSPHDPRGKLTPAYPVRNGVMTATVLNLLDQMGAAGPRQRLI